MIASEEYSKESKTLLASLEQLQRRRSEYERCESKKRELQTLVDDLSVRFDDVDRLLNEVR
jgi:molecular chaperone GrpE (heat shock protein)